MVEGRNVHIDYRWAAGDARAHSQIRRGTGRARARRHPCIRQPDGRGHCNRHPHGPDRVRWRSPTRSAPASSPAWHARRQHHRLHAFRIRHERKVAGAAQGDRARRYARGGSARSHRRRRYRAVLAPFRPWRRRFGMELQSDRRARCRRDRARRSRLRARAEWRPDRDAERRWRMFIAS